MSLNRKRLRGPRQVLRDRALSALTRKAARAAAAGASLDHVREAAQLGYLIHREGPKS